jgi:hypothetical protein
MTQPKHALPRRRPEIQDDGIGKAPRVGVREHDDARLDQQANEDTSSRPDALHQDALHQDAWVTNFIGRLAGLVRHIGGKR